MYFEEQSFTYMLMAFTSYAEVWRAAHEEEILPSQTVSAHHNCALSQKKIQIYKHSVKLSKLRNYNACFVTSSIDYWQRRVKLLLCLAVMTRPK